MNRRELLRGMTAAVPLASTTGCSWIRPRHPRLELSFITDIHTIAGWDVPDALALSAEKINAHCSDLLLIGGDLVHTNPGDDQKTVNNRWAVYRDFSQQLNRSTVYAIGNHDLAVDETQSSDQRRDKFRAVTGTLDTSYTTDALGFRIIVLDSIGPGNHDFRYRGYIGPEQMQWLEETLANTPVSQPLILLTHMPLVSGFWQAKQGNRVLPAADRLLVNNKEVLQRFKRHNLRVVLQGHLHVNEHLRWNGIDFITGGAICGKWWRGHWQGTAPGFGRLSIDEQETQWRYETTGWQTTMPKECKQTPCLISQPVVG